MKPVKFLTKISFTLVLNLVIATAISLPLVSTAHAQSPVYAEVDRTRLGTGETLTLSIVISGADAGSPQLPIMDGFQVVSEGKSSQLTIINGVINSQVSYRYVLAPTRDGMLTIPEIAVRVDGQQHTTQPITIEVTAGAAPLQPVQPMQPSQPRAPSDFNPTDSQGLVGQDAYAEASVDNPTPYVGEQVIYSFRFYRAVNFFDQPSYSAPSFSGFWTEGESQQYDYDVQAAGRSYRVIELQTALFPTSAGEHTIDPAMITIPGSFFSRGTQLTTAPITLNVRPVPEPAPNGFRGAVGQFTISTNVDNDHLTVNEPLTLQVVVAGDGNISTLPEPEMPIMDGWRVFDATSEVLTTTQNGGVSGSRVTEQLLIPEQAGDFTIPAIHYTFFNPQTESYQTVSSDPITVNVAESVGSPGAYTPGAQLPGNDNSTTVNQAGDIRHIKPVPAELSTGVEPILASPLYWGLWLLPLGALVMDGFISRRKRYQAENPELIRSSKAAKKAHRWLSKSHRDKGDAYATIGEVLNTYLSERFNQPIAGMTQSRLVEFLEGQDLPPSIIERITETLLWSEMGRYGAVDDPSSSVLEMYRVTGELIADIEKALAQAK